MVYLFLCIGLLILLGGGKLLVDGASSLALNLGLSQGFIGLTIVAFGTSAPELLVSLNAALDGKGDISIGNVIGSNIANISLVLGISAIVFPIKISSSVFKVDYIVLISSSLIFYFLSLNGIISRFEGFLLLLILILINIYFFFKLGKVDLNELVADLILPLPKWKSISFLILGIFGLYYGADLFVESSIEIASIFGVSERIIGITVIAIGTSLPEMATSIIAALNKKTDIAIGNILGSNIMNILAIIGATAAISPIPVSEGFLNLDFYWMLGLTIVLFPILRSGDRVSRIEGVFLFAAYCTYIFIIL
ncbi:sodium:calcium antiporter [Cognataquiflexum rubidum]|uniref:sodium:calcium antiporter n=1 Tax=Cognataquiflexum rubidum TaxID=2922273 RepID=UPI001F1364E7|nr:sodium:calcium antiporter [Cognataquiflexum rubidum]MCH6234618.1 sodium:calcium antiporter [Cognataquiflexum rubidum]